MLQNSKLFQHYILGKRQVAVLGATVLNFQIQHHLQEKNIMCLLVATCVTPPTDALFL